MGEVPVKLTRPAIKWARLDRAIVNPDHRRDFGEIAAREDFIGALEIWKAQRFLYHRNAVGAQQLDHALAGDAIKERSVRRRRVDDIVLRHEYVRIAEFRDIAQQVEHQAIGKATRLRLDQRARIVRIKARRLGIDRRTFHGRAPEWRQGD